MSHLRRVLLIVLPVLATALFAAGCGSDGKDIADVKSCLKDAKLKVEDLKEDKDVKSGVFASTDLTKVEDGEFTFAMAAHVTSESAIKEFKKESEAFRKTSGAEDKLDFETGVDGKYAWVAGGAKDTDDYKDARACVKP